MASTSRWRISSASRGVAAGAGLAASSIVERCDMGEVPLWHAASSRFLFCNNPDHPSQGSSGASRSRS